MRWLCAALVVAWLAAAALAEEQAEAQAESVQNVFVLGQAQRVLTGLGFGEGPVWLGAEGLVFSDVAGDKILRANGDVFRSPSGKANGLAIDAQGRLVACEHWNRRVSRTDAAGRSVELAASCEGKRFNSPNDVTVRSDGTIIFTDPDYGLEGREKETPFQGVYAIRPGGETSLLSKELEYPNGVVLSPGEKTLYVGDSVHGFVKAFAIGCDTSLSKGRRFCDCPTPDGMKVDAAGRLWVAAADGVRVYSVDGALLEIVALPEKPATNLAFAGEDARTLYVTTPRSLYKLNSAVQGFQHPQQK